jgi:hypothetical protein
MSLNQQVIAEIYAKAYFRPGYIRSRFEYIRPRLSLQPGVVCIDSRRQGVQGC